MVRNTFTAKDVSTVFVVRNVSLSRKTIKIFGMRIGWGRSYDLLTIPDVSESDIRHSLLKGELKRKADAAEIFVVRNTIDLTQFDNEQRTFLESIGVDFTSEATVWDDLRVPLNAVKLAGVKDPSFDTFLGGVRAFSFSNQAVLANEEEVFFAAQLPHTYKEGSDIIPHLHWSPSTAGAGTVRWGLEYTWANVNDIFQATTTAYAEAATNNNSNEQLIASFGNFSGIEKRISSMLICRLFRNSSHANDTYGDGAFLIEFDFHFEKDALGSIRTFIK